MKSEEARLKCKHTAMADDLKASAAMLMQDHKDIAAQNFEGNADFTASWLVLIGEVDEAVGDFDKAIVALQASWGQSVASATSTQACEAALTVLKDSESEQAKTFIAARKHAKSKVAEAKGQLQSLSKRIVQLSQMADAKVAKKKSGAAVPPLAFGRVRGA